ncbi:putative XPG/Rad2 endonuclease [Rosa chinensis]|uniref:Putative XPG/Rad2 endonuclease n=1 Tax=Rosa chinensis TaxID=74649 RepID=A0A2P6SE29_ROSCH|nr:putative XPG/Rad2 endonuclease [Rosa chinensis]
MCNLSIKLSFVGLKLLRHTSLYFAEHTTLFLSVLLVVRVVLKLQKGNQMPEDYPRSFREAAAVFQHAQVYDSDKKIIKHMRPIPQELVESLDGELDFIGSYFFVIYFLLLSG